MIIPFGILRKTAAAGGIRRERPVARNSPKNMTGRAGINNKFNSVPHSDTYPNVSNMIGNVKT